MHPYSGVEQQIYYAGGVGLSCSPTQMNPQVSRQGLAVTKPLNPTWSSNGPQMNYCVANGMTRPELGSAGLSALPPAGLRVNSATPQPALSSQTFVQPHLAKYNTWMSGFPSPVVVAASGSTVTNTSPASRTPFSCSTLGTTYQFPSPTPAYVWSGSSIEGGTMSSLGAGIQMTSEKAGLPGTSQGFGKCPKQSFASAARNKFHVKRKMRQEEDEACRPQKVFVDEERMANRLQELNLDNNNLGWHPNMEEQPWYSHCNNNNNNGGGGGHSTTQDDESDISDIEDCADGLTSDLPRLELSDALKVKVRSKELLPKAIMDELNKPNLQVVLWKPPGDFITEKVLTHGGLPTSYPPGDQSPADSPGDTQGDTMDVVSPPVFEFPRTPAPVAEGSLPSDQTPGEPTAAVYHSDVMFDSMDDSMDL